MNILIATTSFVPAPGISHWGSHEGEIAHAALGLAKALRVLGHRVTLIAPFNAYSRQGIELAVRLSPLLFKIGDETHTRIVHNYRLPSGVDLVLIEGEDPYELQDLKTIEFSQRIAWFGHAVTAFTYENISRVAQQSEESEFESVICVGVGASFITYAMNLLIQGASLVLYTASVIKGETSVSEQTTYQHILASLSRIVLSTDPYFDLRLPQHALHSVGISQDEFVPAKIEFYGEASLMKAGLIASDRFLTFGEAWRNLCVQVNSSHRLDGAFRAYQAKLSSMGSGVDLAHYNPSIDPYITFHFDAEDVRNKQRNKTDFLSEFELDRSMHLPMFAWLESTCPPSWLLLALEQALRNEIIVAIATSTTLPQEIQIHLQRMAKTYPGRVMYRAIADELLFHRILSAADLLVVTNPMSPTGVSIRAAQRYGTVPIALKGPHCEESISDADPTLQTGTGFLFEQPDEQSALSAIQRAITAFQLQEWPKLRRRVMRIEGGWERAARKLGAILKQFERE